MYCSDFHANENQIWNNNNWFNSIPHALVLVLTHNPREPTLFAQNLDDRGLPCVWAMPWEAKNAPTSQIKSILIRLTWFPSNPCEKNSIKTEIHDLSAANQSKTPRWFFISNGTNINIILTSLAVINSTVYHNSSWLTSKLEPRKRAAKLQYFSHVLPWAVHRFCRATVMTVHLSEI